MDALVEKLQKQLQGDVTVDISARRRVRHDASIFELTPDAVVEPQTAADIETLVSFVTKHKASYPKLSITPRGAGTDMSGGAIGSSLLLDTTTHLKESYKLKGTLLHTQPGVFLRDIDRLLSEHGRQLGCAPVSRSLCTIGGVVANNAGGEQSLRYGNADRAVRELTVILADGKSYKIKPLNKRNLDRKIAEKTYESELYRKVYQLIENNYDIIRNARPRTSKNTMGYNLWNVWDRDTQIFDMTQLFTGSQGTLGIITDIVIDTAPKAPHSGTLLVHLSSTRKLADIITTVMAHSPATFEGVDDITFRMGLRHLKTLRKQLGNRGYLRQQAHLTKSVATLKPHIPNMLLMVGFEGNTSREVASKIETLYNSLKPFNVRMDIEAGADDVPLRHIRHTSFALLRSQGKSRHAAPFIDDIAVQPRYVATFLPELRKLLRKHKLPVTIQGHLGDGNFHVLPLIAMSGAKNQAKLEAVMRELIPIVVKYGGTMAGEHNDGMVRGSWLPAVFGQDVYTTFRQVKEIFDPLYIFNPHKKTDASWEFSTSHIRSQTDNDLMKRY